MRQAHLHARGSIGAFPACGTPQTAPPAGGASGEQTEELGDNINVAEIVELVGTAVDLVGVAVIVVGIVVASVIFAVRLQGRPGREDYRRYRQGIGRAILLGLEFLVAGDIIRTVAVSPTFQSVGVLAAIVAIRTFLSMSLEVELEGRWPWDRAGRSRSGREAERDSSGDQERGR